MTQYETLENRLRRTPYLVVDPADENVQLIDEASALDLMANRPGATLILNALGALHNFARLKGVGTDDREFALKDIAAIMGVKYHACHFYVREGYVTPSVQRAADSGRYYPHTFDWTDAYIAGIIGTLKRAGQSLKLSKQLQPLFCNKKRLGRKQQSSAQA